jgi:hypothetical protein|tara:strand:- start:216 stop:752 length:537 start_codon:yes stop_codon:yes gene_type:complete
MKYPKHIEVIDDFLSNEEFTDLINIVNDDFAWYRGYTIDENSDNEFTPIKKYTPKEKSKQFRHIFIHHEHGENSPYVSIIYPILFKLKAKNVLKVKMNLTTNSNKAVIGGWHRDYDLDSNAKIAILYVNDNNGFTLLEDGTKIKSKANRLVKFNNKIMHTCVSQTDVADRLVLNMGYI